VQHREKPDLCAEMSRIGSDGAQRLGGCVEQDLVDSAGILEGNRGDLVGNGEDDMEILGIEKLLPPSLDPFRSGEPLALGATAGTAAVVRDPSFATAVALFDMASERRRSTALDGSHCCASFRRLRCPVLLSPGSTVSTEYIRDFRT
jgi:hypothetical protein